MHELFENENLNFEIETLLYYTNKDDVKESLFPLKSVGLKKDYQIFEDSLHFDEFDDDKLSDLTEKMHNFNIDINTLMQSDKFRDIVRDDSFEKLVSMIVDYKKKYGHVDLPNNLIQDIILLYKVRYIQSRDVKSKNENISGSISDINVEDISEITYSISDLKVIINELGLEVPIVTKEDVCVYKSSLNSNQDESAGREDINEYKIFRDYLFGHKYNDDFNSLISLYEKDKIGFYSACIKSEKYKQGFKAQVGDYTLKLRFQTNKFDDTYKRYITALEHLKKLTPVLENNINKIKICGLSIKEDAKEINFEFAESYALLHSFRLDPRFKKGYFSGNFSASYYDHEKRINLYYNSFLKAHKKRTKKSLFHEFGHFLHYTYCDRSIFKDRDFEILKSFLIKDYKLSIHNRKLLRYYPDQRYFNHVTPPLDLLARKKDGINTNSYSSELFAEITSNIMVAKMKKNDSKSSKKLKCLNEMFHHTNYLVGQILKGKGVNKYKCFKK